MEKVVRFILENWELVLAIATIVLAVLRRAMEGTLQELLAEAIGLLVDLAHGELEKVTREEVAAVAGLVYDKFPEWARRFISEEVWVEAIWQAWLKFLAARAEDRGAAQTLYAAAAKKK